MASPCFISTPPDHPAGSRSEEAASRQNNLSDSLKSIWRLADSSPYAPTNSVIPKEPTGKKQKMLNDLGGD